VSVRAKEFIENIYAEPILDLSVFNADLYKRIKVLGEMNVRLPPCVDCCFRFNQAVIASF